MNSKNSNSKNIEERVSACFGTLNLCEVIDKTDFDSQIRLFELTLQSYRFCENYYFIAHDDTQTPHIHFVIEFCGSKRLKTILNDFERFGYNRNAVSVDKLGLLSSAIRYMIHCDESSIDDGKKPYSLDFIVSNMSYEYLESLILLDDKGELTFSKLVDIATDCDFNMMKIGMKLGLKTYKQYRYVIRDICDNEYRLRLQREKIESKRISANVPF